MAHQRLASLTALACTFLMVTPAFTARGFLGQSPPSRVVAIGDVHGAGDAFVGILQAANLIDADRKWSGGTATFVQTGDYLDRGGAVRQILDLLMILEDQAKSAGGRVEV